MSMKQTGLCQVYVMHCPGFSGEYRPAHDSHPDARQEMTHDEVRTMVRMIHRYMFKCAERRKKCRK